MFQYVPFLVFFYLVLCILSIRQLQQKMGCINPKMVVAPAQETPITNIEKPVPIQYVQKVLKPLHPSDPHPQLQPIKEETPIDFKDSPAKSSTKASKNLEQPINTETVDGKLLAAQRSITNNDPKTAIYYYEQVVTSIGESKDRSIKTMEIRAYCMAQLGTLYAQQKKLSQTYFCSNEALKFYERFQSDYFEEIITLLNNMALWKENEKNYDEAIKNYLRIIDIEDKYMAKNDERTLLTKNNLACMYFESGKHINGEQLFKSLERQMQLGGINPEVASLIHTNHEHYIKQ